MEAIVLAGGFGTRLASRLNGLPKPMASVAGRPFLEILLTQLRWSGCTRVLLSVGHQHSVIQDHFATAFGGMTIDYVIESVPLGTGGAIRLALAQAREDSVLVLNGDTFLDAAAGLNGDTIANFGGSDVIDLNNLNSSSAVASYNGSSTAGQLDLTDGTNTAAISLVSGSGLGSSAFTLSNDNHGGTLITLR